MPSLTNGRTSEVTVANWLGDLVVAQTDAGEVNLRYDESVVERPGSPPRVSVLGVNVARFNFRGCSDCGFGYYCIEFRARIEDRRITLHCRPIGLVSVVQMNLRVPLGDRP
jgi:hypothetical protein